MNERVYFIPCISCKWWDTGPAYSNRDDYRNCLNKDLRAAGAEENGPYGTIVTKSIFSCNQSEAK